MIIVVEEASLSRSDHGLITGTVHFVLDGYDFPERGWSDFPVVILSWWLEKAAALLGGRSPSVELGFMDGPFVVAATLDADRGLRLTGVRTVAKRQTFASGRVSVDSFCLDLIRAARTIEKACLERGWESADARHLSQNIRSLERLLAEGRTQA